MSFYRSYPFKEYDPAMEQVTGLIEDSDKPLKDINEGSDVSLTTMYNWRKKKTKKPQFATLNAVARSLGKEFRLMPIRKNNR